jgi:hypothetical protein
VETFYRDALADNTAGSQLWLRAQGGRTLLDFWRFQRRAGLPVSWTRRVARAVGAAGWRTIRDPKQRAA